MKEFHEMIILGEKQKKKGGSLAAVLKLITDLTDFEEKIEVCADAQEMSQNKQKIKEFTQDIDKMYKVLLGMAQGGIKSLRSDDLGIPATTPLPNMPLCSPK